MFCSFGCNVSSAVQNKNNLTLFEYLKNGTSKLVSFWPVPTGLGARYGKFCTLHMPFYDIHVVV